MSLRLELLSGFIFILSFISPNAQAVTGEGCYEKYAELISDQVPPSFQQTWGSVKDALNCLYHSSTLTKKAIGVSWYSASAGVQFVAEGCKLAKGYVNYIRGAVSESKYRETLELMTLLRNWNSEMGDFHSERDFLVKMNWLIIEETQGYQELVSSKLFLDLANTKKVEPRHYAGFAKRLNYEYLFGITFCGEASTFNPITLEELHKAKLSLTHWEAHPHLTAVQ